MADPEGFDAFVLGSRRRLLGQLTLMTGDPDQAAEALQEAYLRAWQRWGRVAGLADPEAWVRTVAWRYSVSRWRRALVARRALPRLLPSDSGPNQSDLVLDVRAALSRLPEGQRLVLVLHELCDLSVEQVAAETGLAVGTVKSRLARGRRALASFWVRLGRRPPMSDLRDLMREAAYEVDTRVLREPAELRPLRPPTLGASDRFGGRGGRGRGPALRSGGCSSVGPPRRASNKTCSARNTVSRCGGTCR